MYICISEKNAKRKINFMKNSKKSKVFRDFVEISHMKKGPTLAIASGIIIAIVFCTAYMYNQEQDTIKIENTANTEDTTYDEISPEIQLKLDEIEEINLENEYTPKKREWITSGPFQIDRSEYVIGEKIFLVIGGLQHQEKGQVAFLRPLNDTHYSVYQTIPFDGAKKNAFNYYIQPQLSKVAGLCTIDDIVGDWTVVFRGTTYANLEFKITNEIIPGDETNYQSVC